MAHALNTPKVKLSNPTPSMPPPQPSPNIRRHLVSHTNSFISAFLTGDPPEHVLNSHFTRDSTNRTTESSEDPPLRPMIHEHISLPPTSPLYSQLSTLLPFLMGPFIGHEACLKYFSLLSKTLGVEFPVSESPPPSTTNRHKDLHTDVLDEVDAEESVKPGRFSDGTTFRNSGQDVPAFKIESTDPQTLTVTVRGRARFWSQKNG